MTRLVLLAVCVLGTASCGKDEPPTTRRPGLFDSNGNPINNARPSAPPRPVPAEPDPFREEYRPPPPAPAEPRADPVDAAAPEDAAPRRDLRAELSSALSRVASCVDLAQAAAQRDGRLVISVSAVVLGTGRISRATVTAPGQPSGSLTCIQDMTVGMTLPPGVPGAPLTVIGTTELTVKPARAQPGDAAIPSPIPIAPTRPVTPGNPDVAQPQADDMARPVNEGLAGPP